MRIVRGNVPEVDQFTTIPNEWVRDPSLSLRARGVLALLLSHSEGWHSSADAIAREATEGRDAVRTALRELETVGYLVRHRPVGEDGKYLPGEYILQSPSASTEPAGQTIDGFPGPGKPPADSQAYKKNNYKKNNKDMRASADARVRNDYPEDFEEFWRTYPRREGPNPKKPAYSKWRTAIKAAEPSVILAGVKAYAASELPDDRRMIPQAATWLSQERWVEEAGEDATAWLRTRWVEGDAAAVTARTGLIYNGVVWPDELPTTPEEKARIRLEQARAWITENHERIIERLTHVV